MANDFITINRGASTLSSLLGTSRDSLELTGDTVMHIYNQMGHLTDGVTFTALETALGLPTGAGTVVYSAYQQVALLFSNPDPNVGTILRRMR